MSPPPASLPTELAHESFRFSHSRCHSIGSCAAGSEPPARRRRGCRGVTAPALLPTHGETEAWRGSSSFPRSGPAPSRGMEGRCLRGRGRVRKARGSLSPAHSDGWAATSGRGGEGGQLGGLVHLPDHLAEAGPLPWAGAQAATTGSGPAPGVLCGLSVLLPAVPSTGPSNTQDPGLDFRAREAKRVSATANSLRN